MIAFIVWTPLHLYNCLTFIITHDLIEKCDLYYVCQSNGMKNYYDECKKLGIFSNIYYTDRRDIEKERLWEFLGAVISAKQYVKHIFGSKAINNAYSKIYISVPARLNDAVINANKCEEICGYDDGTGSYVRNLYKKSLGSKYEWVKKIKGEKLSSKVTTVYLNCPEFILLADETLCYKRLSIRDMSASEKQLLHRAFYYNDEKSNLPQYIYINQPLDDNTDSQSHKNIENKIIKTIRNAVNKDELIVRLHPRERNPQFYKDLRIEDDRKMWEVLCESSITDEHCLISSFSTALLTPKLLFDREPCLVFTYKIYDDYSEEDKKNYQLLIEQLKAVYRKPQNIYIPQDINELEKLLHNNRQ